MEPADQYVYLKTEIKARDAALQAKNVELDLKDKLLQSKDAVIEAKNAVIHAIDAEMQRLQAESAAANCIKNKKRVDRGKRLGGHSRDGGRKHRAASTDPADPSFRPYSQPLLELSGLNIRYGSKHRAVHPDPADPAFAPLLAQQPQVHFIHLLPPFLLSCHPIFVSPPLSSGAGVR